MSNTLIVYYSHSGNTRKMAKIIAEQLHADCLEIIPQKPLIPKPIMQLSTKLSMKFLKTINLISKIFK